MYTHLINDVHYLEFLVSFVSFFVGPSPLDIVSLLLSCRPD